MIKIHGHLLRSTLELVHRILLDPTLLAESTLQSTLKGHRKWGSKDRRLVSETFYTLLRHWRKLAWQAGLPEAQGDLSQHPAISLPDVYNVWSAYAKLTGVTAPPLPEFTNIGEIELRSLEDASLAVRESLPDWWVEQWQPHQAAPATAELAAALNQPAKVHLRVNPIKTTRDQVLEELEENGISAEIMPETPLGIRLHARPRLADLEGFQQGWFEVQDLGSQQICVDIPWQQLPKVPVLRIVDLCAGGGGKTLHLAALLQEHDLQAEILACDVVERKLQETATRWHRAGADVHASLTLHDLAEPLPETWLGTAHLVLVDAPCSGSGVVRRNPDSKWKLTPERLAQLVETQASLLNDAASLLLPGGLLHYATCSVFPAENAQQVAAFLARTPQARLLAEKAYLPSVQDSDGFYAATLEVSPSA